MQRLPVSVTTLRRARAGALLVCALAIAVGNPPCGRAQVPSRYTTGGEILRLDFASTAIGDFPAGIKTLNGTMDIVEKDGMHMLRASSPSEVLLKLPQVLPEKFTIELDIVPKACCAPDDIAIEGTDMDHRGSGTAQITWQSPRISVVGGAPDMYQAPMPDALQVSTPGVLTHIVLTVENETIQLYTNGRRLFTLTDRKFARRNVLWLMLGGADDGPNALYLARLRIINNTVLTPNNAGQCPPGTVTCSAKTGAPAPTPNPPTEPQTGSGAPAPGKTTPGPSSIQTTALRNPNWGVTVSWTPVPNAIGYRVHRTISGGTPAVVVDLVTNGPNQCVSAGTPTSALPCSGIDPFVLPVVLYDYWVEAVFGPSGTLSAPSATSTVETGEPPPLPDLNASVGGTKLVTGPGALSSLGAISGSEVTWTWDPTGRGQFAYLFSYEIVGGMTGVGPVIERGSVRNQDPLNGTTTMTVVRGVPQGKQVKFCVAFFADPDVTKPFDPRYSKCLVTQVP